MILALLFLLPMLLASVWLFARAQPSTERVVALRRYNRAVISAASLSALAVTGYFWATTGQSVDSAWWPVLAVLGGTFVVALALIIGAIVRIAVFRQGTTK